jgi:hypothetical protein
MNPFLRTGAGSVDDTTARVVLAANSPGVPLNYDSIELTYVGATNNLATVVYKLATVTVETLTFAYVGGTPTVDNARLATVTKS